MAKASLKVVVRTWLYWAALAVFAFAPLIVLAFLWVPLGGIHMGDYTLWNGWFIILAYVVFWLCSIRSVETDEFGGITFFNIPVREVENGPVIVLPKVMELATLSRNVIEFQFPAEPERIFYGPDDANLPKGMVRPIRITTGGPSATYAGDDLLNVRLTFEPQVSVHLQVEKIGFFEFYVNIPGRTWKDKMEYVFRRMNDAINGILGVEFRNRPAGQVIHEQPEIREHISERVVEVTHDWGVNVCEVEMQNIEPPYEVNKALASIPAQKAAAQATTIAAAAERKRLLEEATGQAEGRERLADARKKELTVEGEGLKAAADALGVPGTDYLAANVARDTLGKGTVVLGVEGAAQAVGGVVKGLFKERTT